jgi:hypothetical protein
VHVRFGRRASETDGSNAARRWCSTLPKLMGPVKWSYFYPALLNLKQCCADVRAFEIRILASSIEKQLVLDAFMQI